MVSLAAIIAASASTATAFLAPANINIHTIRRSTITTTSTTTITTTMPTFHRKIHIVWADKPPDDGGGKGGGGNSNSNGNGTGNGLDDFLDPKKAFQESDNLKRARAALSEDALPITFKEEGSGTGTGTVSGLDAQDDDGQSQDINDEGSTINSNNNNNITEEEEKENKEKAEEENANVSADSDTDPDTDSSGSTALTSTSSDLVVAMNEKNNAYLNVVAKLSPSDLISKFTTTAHPRVQDAVRSTILGLIGTLPQMAFETTTITTGERLASLMFQLQMTGYMFKNAEYRLSLSQSLGMSSTSTSTNMMLLLEGDGDDGVQLDDDDDDEDGPLSSGQVRGKIKVRYGVKRDDETASSSSSSDAANDDESKGSDEDEKDEKENSSPGMEVEVDAAAYMAELRNEVAKLRDDLSATRKSKEEAIRKDLLLYIRTLPQQELNTLTDTMSNDVMGAMKGLVNVVMGGIGEGQIDKDTVTEQSGEAMAQLCMWQLVVGYNLRELEVREEMKNALVSGSLDNDNGNGSNGESGVEDDDGNDDTDDGKGSIDYGSGGFE
uniref:Uncharacterized protein n=1 Tax=Chaetoceros debilis TaxID=122233 RepID=A0A7S3QAW7_9STRA